MPAGASDSFGPALEGTPVSHRWSATWLSALPNNLSNSVLQDRLCGSRTSQLADDCGFQDRMSRGCPLSHAFQDSCRVVFQVGSVADGNLQVRVDSQPSRSAPPELLRRF